MFHQLPLRVEVELIGKVSFVIEDMGLRANVFAYESCSQGYQLTFRP